MSGTVPPFGAHTGNPSSLIRAGNPTDTINNPTTTNVVPNVDENLYRYPVFYNGENIMTSITEGPFQMGTLIETRAEETEGALQLGPERARVFADLSAEEKERYKADNRATNNLLQGSELTKDDRESQVYDEFEHFRQIKGETIHIYYVRGLKESNFDQLYAYLKQHEVHDNENIMMMERFIQPTNDPLALVSNASVQQYLTQSSMSPQSSNEPSPADNFQLDSRSSLTENLIKRPKLQFKTAKLLFRMFVVDTMRIIKEDHFRGTMQEEMLELGMLEDSDYFKDKMLLMQAHENGAVLDEEHLLFLAGEYATNFDDDVDDPPEQDLALNVDHIIKADQCDAFDSDVDEAPTTQTMFMINLSSEDPIYDEAGPSYDSNTLSEVQDHDTFADNMDEYHEVHEMQNDVQHNYVVDSDAEYTSDSNIIPYNQFMEDNEENVIQSNVSSVKNNALMLIINEMHEEGVQSRLANKPDKVVNDSLTSELMRYKELVGEYEKRAKFELTEREQKIDEQMRIIISDQNRKETSLKSELHSVQMQLRSTLDHYKSKTEEVTILKKDFKQKEDKFLEEFLDIKN
ncbi:hypothetical protein Tco_0185748 [Tanacetum coccineum]